MVEAKESSWTRTLTDVEQAVNACLTALEKYEFAFAGVLTDHGRPTAIARVATVENEEWTARLAAAQARADEVERLLVEQQNVWNDWRRAYTDWRQSLEQAPAAMATTMGNPSK